MNKLGEGERKVRLGQDSLPNIHFRSGNERKVGTLFYLQPDIYGLGVHPSNTFLIASCTKLYLGSHPRLKAHVHVLNQNHGSFYHTFCQCK